MSDRDMLFNLSASRDKEMHMSHFQVHQWGWIFFFLCYSWVTAAHFVLHIYMQREKLIHLLSHLNISHSKVVRRVPSLVCLVLTNVPSSLLKILENSSLSFSNIYLYKHVKPEHWQQFLLSLFTCLWSFSYCSFCTTGHTVIFNIYNHMGLEGTLSKTKQLD